MKLGALGDLILVIPSLRMLRKKFPKAYIAVLVDIDLTACLEHCPYIDEVIPFKRKDKQHRLLHLRNIVQKLRQYAFDMSIDFQNNNKTHLIAFLSAIPSRYGYRRGLFGGLLSHGVGSFKDPLPPVQHQFRVLHLLGISECEERLEMWPQKEDYAYVMNVFNKFIPHTKKKKIGFVLSASERWQSKKWPLKNFIMLARRLQRDFGCYIVLIGDKASVEDRDLFVASIPDYVVDMVGRTTISQLAALVDSIDCIVCGDTAPLHVAGAMKKNIVALYGPTDPRRHMPPGSHGKVIKRNISCSPCYNEDCPTDHKCMNEISVEDVYNAIKGHLSK